MNYCMLQAILICGVTVGSTNCNKPVMKCYTVTPTLSTWTDGWSCTATLTLGHVINVPRPSSFLPTLILYKPKNQGSLQASWGMALFCFNPFILILFMCGRTGNEEHSVRIIHSFCSCFIWRVCKLHASGSLRSELFICVILSSRTPD